MYILVVISTQVTLNQSNTFIIIMQSHVCEYIYKKKHSSTSLKSHAKVLLCHVTLVVHSRSTIAMIFLCLCIYVSLNVLCFIMYAPSSVMYLQNDYYIIMIIYSLSIDCRITSCYNAT